MSSIENDLVDNERSIDNLVEITCHAYSSDFFDHDPENPNAGSGLNLWCLDRESMPIHLIIKDAPIYCYVELPKFLHGTPYRWNEDDIKMLKYNWKKVHGKSAPVKLELVDRQKLYYYKGDKSKDQMVRAYFTSAKMMNIFGFRIKKLTEYPDFELLSFQYYEDKVAVRRKVFTILDLAYSQWFTVRGYEIPFDSPDRQAIQGVEGRRIREILVDSYQEIDAIPLTVSAGWITRPRILSWDIETYTDNHYALPNVEHPNHVVYMISCLYQVSGRPETLERYVIVMGECGEIENATVIRVADEEDVILQFLKLIETLDPEIIMGYNIFNYDYPYIIGRQAQFMKNWYPCSRIEGYVAPEPYDRKWKSSGYRENRICYLELPGRISIDMLAFVKREYPNLDKHSLDFVGNYFLNARKHDVTPVQMFKAFESQDIDEMTRVTKYCIQDSEIVVRLYDKLNVWIGLVEMSSIVGVEIMDLFTRGQQVRCVSQLYDLTARLGIVQDSRDMPEIPYEGGYVGTPIVGIHNGVICLDFSSLYPSIIMAYNICYTTLITALMAKKMNPDKYHTIKIPAIIKNDVVIQAEATYHFVKKEVFEGILPRLVAKLVNERKAVKRQMGVIRGKLGMDDDGVIVNPELRARLTEDEISNFELQLKVLDKRQNGLKISANSMYGFLGVQKGGKLPLIEGAAAITSWGRQLINQVNGYLHEKYGAIVVYNDTDSSMVKIPGLDDPVECYKKGVELAEEISGAPEKKLLDGTIVPAKAGLFPPPLKMEFEKAMRIFCIAKKMYAYYSIGKDGTFVRTKDGNIKITPKGIAIARRDKPGCMKKVYTRLLRAILDMAPIDEAFEIIIKAVVEILYDKNMPIRGNFTIIRGLGSEYKGNYFMKIFADELARMGHPIQPGDKVEYVVVKAREKGEPLGRRLRLIEMYEESQKHPEGVERPSTMYPKEEIDREYYITNIIKNSIDQLFSIGYADVFEGTRLGKRGYRPESKLKFTSIKYPVKMIEKILGDHGRMFKEPEETQEFIENEILTWFREEVSKAVDAIEQVEDNPDYSESDDTESDEDIFNVFEDNDYDDGGYEDD
jgi:DNA polymerase elongation subunit (family B)